MEAAALRRPPRGFSIPAQRAFAAGGRFRRVSFAVSTGSFADGGHLQYYADEEKERKRAKKREKLAKSVAKDLAELCEVGFPVHGDRDVGGREISDAAEMLLRQLKQVMMQEEERMKAAKKAMKMRRKAEIEAMMTEKKNRCAGKDDSSSSESSESSESDDDMEVLDMRKCGPAVLPPPPPPISGLISAQAGVAAVVEDTAAAPAAPKFSSISTNNKWQAERKIEVCIGGKCKKSGSLQLLEEIGKQVGIDGAVVGCKCMGKCKDGPNVRLSSGDNGISEAARFPLCIGVGLDDVGAIVSRFLGDENGVGIAAA